MSSKMASTLCQKLLTNFCQKAQNFVCFGAYDFVQISPARGPNTYQIMHGETLDFHCQQQQYSNIKCPIGKSIFAVDLRLKLFRVTIANADIGSLKSLHTLLKNCWWNLNKIVWSKLHEILRGFFDKKPFFITIFDKELTPFWKRFLYLKLLFNAKLLI